MSTRPWTAPDGVNARGLCPAHAATHNLEADDSTTTMPVQDLFDMARERQPAECIAPATTLLPGRIAAHAEAVLETLRPVLASNPLRHQFTPGGRRMSVRMSCCGDYGWVTDRGGYRYQRTDPLTDAPWPPMPELIRDLGVAAAMEAGFTAFAPDVCLINDYAPGARMGLHQDRDEADFSAPIVSLSLGVPAVFLFGGHRRGDATRKVRLAHGDAIVWGGPDRLRFHGVAPLQEGWHSLTGSHRINLTLRSAAPTRV